MIYSNVKIKSRVSTKDYLYSAIKSKALCDIEFHVEFVI